MKVISAMMSFDTDALTIEDLDKIIINLRNIRRRKAEAENIKNQIHALLEEAHDKNMEVYASMDDEGRLREVSVQ